MIDLNLNKIVNPGSAVLTGRVVIRPDEGGKFTVFGIVYEQPGHGPQVVDKNDEMWECHMILIPVKKHRHHHTPGRTPHKLFYDISDLSNWRE